VVIIETKKSFAAMRRSPRLPATTIWAPSVAATSGSCAAGSACASEPPSVPRVRMA
jgi:hypothetical protein